MTKKLIAILAATLSIAACGSEPAEAAANDLYKEGVHYELVSSPQVTDDPSRVEVAEVFWYGCGHCYSLEPYVKNWLATKPDHVNFVQVPAPLNRVWKHHARLFYTAKALGVQEDLHDKIFTEIHKNKNRLATERAVRKFMVANGVKEKHFDATFEEGKSFTVDSWMANAKTRVEGYGVSSVPALIVNGKYKVTGSKAGGPRQMFKIVDWLVEREKKEL